MNLLTIPSELRKFEELLKKIIERQDAQAEQLEEIINKVTYAELSTKQTGGKFEACAKGFHQIKEACECLLERIDEASGQITAQTWND